MQQQSQAETEEASRQIQQKVHKALKSAIKELPDQDYLFFDLPGRNKKNRKFAAATSKPTSKQKPESTNRRILSFETGPLNSVSVTPESPRRRPGEPCMLKARAVDDDAFAILQDVTFKWKIVEGHGQLTLDGSRCQVTSNERGLLRIELTARQGKHSASETVHVRFIEASESNTSTNRRKGLPTYQLSPHANSQQRSYYDKYQNQIVINSSHQDFVASNTSPAKHRRYIGKLYAKEVVLLNFPDGPARSGGRTTD